MCHFQINQVALLLPLIPRNNCCVAISDISCWCRPFTQPFWYEWSDTFADTMCSSISVFSLFAPIWCTLLLISVPTQCCHSQLVLFFILNGILYGNIFHVLPKLLLSGYCNWWLWRSRRCHIAVWKSFVHIPQPLRLKVTEIYTICRWSW